MNLMQLPDDKGQVYNRFLSLYDYNSNFINTKTHPIKESDKRYEQQELVKNKKNKTMFTKFWLLLIWVLIKR